MIRSLRAATTLALFAVAVLLGAAMLPPGWVLLG